jgi:hypothetical protein
MHAPHDSTYSIATARLPDGRMMAVTLGNEGAVIYSADRGLTWSMLSGEGLELQTAWEVTYHPGLPAAGLAGLFVIATERGIWTWDPVSDVVGTLNTGLPTDDRHMLDLESPLAGSDGPVMALSVKGGVYLLSPQTNRWTLTLSLPPVYSRFGAVALTPHFDSTSGTPGARHMFVASSGELHFSTDGGQNWSLHPQFSTRATSPLSWSIGSLAMAENYASQPVVMIGRIRLTSLGGADVGEIQRSTSLGLGFNPVASLNSGVLHLLCTPPGPGGVRSWLATTRAYPNTGSFLGVGILSSTDAGQTWNHFNNHQDFLMEQNPGQLSGYTPLNYEQQLAVMPDYATTGEVWYGRQEGLFVSRDAGVHWRQRQIRVDREFRDLETATTPDGRKAVFGAGYGGGTIMHIPSKGVVEALRNQPVMLHQRRLSVSPQFALDGNLIVAGNVTLWSWQSDLVAPANPNQKVLWWEPRNLDPNTLLSLTGFPRVVNYSPHFDGRGTPGSDQTYFWCGWSLGPYRSEDNGQTAKALHALSGGGTLGEVTCFAIAPTYNAAGTRTDAYTADQSGNLYRLVNEQWLHLGDLGPMVQDLVVAPNWSRPSNPTLFAALAGAPYVLKIVDNPGSPSVTSAGTGLPEVDASGLVCHPDFANHPIVYLATFGSGVWKLDLAAPTPAWAPVGDAFPPLWCRDVALSPDFSNDHYVFAATQNGIWAARDELGSVWKPLTTSGARDETDESFQYFQPNHRLNPAPDHAWPWTEVKRWSLPYPIIVLGESVRFTTSDGAYVNTEAICSTLSVMTVAGPGAGTVKVEARDFSTGALVGSTTVDLAPLASTPTAHSVSLPLGASHTVRVTVTAILDRGEFLVLDGIHFAD